MSESDVVDSAPAEHTITPSDSECTWSDDSASRVSRRSCYAGCHFTQVKLVSGEVYEGTVLDEFDSVESGCESDDELVLDGIGKLLHPDGSLYKGEFRNGVKHGYGMTLYWNGDKHVGLYRAGQFDGLGTYSGSVFVDNDPLSVPLKRYYYVGDFKDGKYHGAGTIKETDVKTGAVSKFEGEFKDGQRVTLSLESSGFVERARSNVYVAKSMMRTQSMFIPREESDADGEWEAPRRVDDFDQFAHDVHVLPRTRTGPRNLLTGKRRGVLRNFNEAVGVVVPGLRRSSSRTPSPIAI